MKMTLALAALVAGLGALAGNSGAEELAVKPADRPTIRDDRPENLRGWVIVSNSAYWPLCYEALENLTEVREQAASTDRTVLADTLDKCSAWLKLAASAAMVREESRILTIADKMDEVSVRLQDGDTPPTPREIQVLATMGELAIAKSHLIRATKDPSQRKTSQYLAGKKTLSAKLAAEEKEIRKARIERDRDQYRYDAGQSLRHLTVAQAYLRAVAGQGEIELGELATETIAPLQGHESGENLVDKDMEINLLAEKLTNVIDAQQVRLAAELKWAPKP
ncbi:hypothetical protein Enr13x_28920 [Stieleria neptunia]|uniref:Uncharacterized protein n=1 Tax=Stieleria neptunia TaxID=2527979 RepID=A0A518HQC0_9BACT|nr:hypothetical protein [Stieleria neptunia]QDV43040.1 hypothetical protein Enr13x_28920 [Stieleria neptunia]